MIASRWLRTRLGLLALLAVLLPVAGSAESADSSAPKALVVKIHADWCGTCTRLEPTWEALRERYGDDAEFVILDVTDEQAIAAAAETADALGIRTFFDAHKQKTGVVAVLDGSRRPVRVLKGETDASRYDAPIAEALKAS